MVVIRLARKGSTHYPKYRVTVADQRYAATGKFIEVVGTYNPFPCGQEIEVNLKLDRIKDWVSKGAQPTKRVKSLIRKMEAGA